MTKATHVVSHQRLYLAVEGKLTHIPQGSPLTLTAEKAKKLGNRVTSMSDVETLDLTDSLTALKARAKELGVSGTHKMGESRLIGEIAKAEAAAVGISA